MLTVYVEARLLSDPVPKLCSSIGKGRGESGLLGVAGNVVSFQLIGRVILVTGASKVSLVSSSLLCIVLLLCIILLPSVEALFTLGNW